MNALHLLVCPISGSDQWKYLWQADECWRKGCWVAGSLPLDGIPPRPTPASPSPQKQPFSSSGIHSQQLCIKLITGCHKTMGRVYKSSRGLTCFYISTSFFFGLFLCTTYYDILFLVDSFNSLNHTKREKVLA